jgi:hypothetical protein
MQPLQPLAVEHVALGSPWASSFGAHRGSK